MEAWSPAWITRPFGANALLDREAREVNETELKIYGRAHPSLLDSGTPYVGCNEEGTGWFDMIADCRQTFVYMELHPARGP